MSKPFLPVDAQPSQVRDLFAAISPRYDLANHLLSGGLDFYWRWVTARTVAGWNPERIIDWATGSGDLAIALGRHCPTATVVGADFCFPMLTHAREKGLSRLVAADALAPPFADESFDAVTVAFGLRNMADWGKALQNMSGLLRPGGRVAVLDFSLPGPWLRGFYRWYLHHVLPRLAGWITGRPEAYEYLGGSIEAFPSGAEMCRLMESNGFATASCRRLSLGIVSLYTAEKAPSA